LSAIVENNAHCVTPTPDHCIFNQDRHKSLILVVIKALPV
jgi:hypothetical protein